MHLQSRYSGVGLLVMVKINVVMFGGLHIEMVALKMLGDLLEGSGWTGALFQAGITNSENFCFR